MLSQDIHNDNFIKFCSMGNKELANLSIDSVEDYIAESAFNNSCDNNHYNMAKWIYEKHNTIDIYGALERACMKGDFYKNKMVI